MSSVHAVHGYEAKKAWKTRRRKTAADKAWKTRRKQELKKVKARVRELEAETKKLRAAVVRMLNELVH